MEKVLVTSIFSFFHNVFKTWSKLKAFADNKINVNQILKFDLERVESFVRKGENAGY